MRVIRQRMLCGIPLAGATPTGKRPMSRPLANGHEAASCCRVPSQRETDMLIAGAVEPCCLGCYRRTHVLLESSAGGTHGSRTPLVNGPCST